MSKMKPRVVQTDLGMLAHSPWQSNPKRQPLRRIEHKTGGREHEEVNKAWIRHHCQPRKKLCQPGDDGGEESFKLKSHYFLRQEAHIQKVVLASPMGTTTGPTMYSQVIGKHPLHKHMSFGPEKSVVDKMDRTSSSSLQ